MNLNEALLVLASLALAAPASAYNMMRSKFVRPVRSWRTIPTYQQPSYQEALPAYYPAYDEFEAANNGDYAEDYDRYAEEPGSNLPIGQETWFEEEKSKVNDAFMQNLMELYRHQPAQEAYYGYDSHPGYYNDQPQYYSPNDEQQLKLLKRSSDDESSSTEAPTTSTRSPAQGQKEVPMLRPPNPAKGHAEVKPTAHPSSVYDAIKRLLTIEDLQEGQGHQGHIKKTQKRFAPSEESLVKQLNGLKKMSA